LKSLLEPDNFQTGSLGAKILFDKVGHMHCAVADFLKVAFWG